ncbi:MAG TPA: dihydropteroate synthase [Candidatus Saccharimonadia bacterium]|nr:dihydropteroate synthase [Candidatus Saccharimonadia bacterium]
MFEAPIPTLDCNGRKLILDRARIMGVLNLTPDSFSDGGAYGDVDTAVARGVAMVEEGADLVDIGGESTRPGANAVTAAEEIARVVPVIEALSKRVVVPISIDTSKPEVMRAAVAAGAGLVNDVRALQADGAIEACAELGVPVVLMHMLGEPRTMQDDPQYDDVVAEVHRFLAQRLLACDFAGIDRKRVLVDPGFGFGKSLEHNVALLRALRRFTELGVPVVAGLSRKATIGKLTGREVPAERVHGSVAAALVAVQRGAAIVRVHDVAATRDALSVWQAIGPEPAAKAASSAKKISLFDDD